MIYACIYSAQQALIKGNSCLGALDNCFPADSRTRFLPLDCRIQACSIVTASANKLNIYIYIYMSIDKYSVYNYVFAQCSHVMHFFEIRKSIIHPPSFSGSMLIFQGVATLLASCCSDRKWVKLEALAFVSSQWYTWLVPS